ncbi:MAG: sensor domain-containing diguanylate cyclase [Methylovirgula sp.]
MTAFIVSQLDFIFFFYGLAFILLGVTCFGLARADRISEPWAVLGLFGFVHGASEWLDLTALVIGDSPTFAGIRLAVMTGSFLILMESAQQEAIRRGLRLPGRWLYVPLTAFVIFAGVLDGVDTAGAVARYSIGFPAAMGTSIMFAWHARDFSGAYRRWAIVAASGFAIYGIAAGLIVPVGTFWPASHFNYQWFIQLTGVPVQLLRGLVACAIALSIWTIWGQRLSLEVSSARYTAYLRQQFIWTLLAMATILISGWMLTQFLGDIYKHNVQDEARSDIDLLASHLAGETALVDGMVKALAGTPSILPLLMRANPQDHARAKSVLGLDVDASGATLGYILDRSGNVVASSDRRDGASSGTTNHRSSEPFQTSIAGKAGHHFAFDIANRTQNYYASYPVRSATGTIVGVAVLKKSLRSFAADLKQFDRPYFFVDPHGVVVLTNRPKMLLRTLWPLSTETRSLLTSKFGMLNDRPMLKHEIVDGAWTQVDGVRDYVRRHYAAHSQWSLILLKPMREIFASRVLGLIVTLLVTITTLIYLFARERWIHDNIQMDHRLALQEQAQELKFRATTDPLTGLSNRLKFDQAIAKELLRAERYKAPLSLILFDIDHFKDVNDGYGHLVGDKVLIQLSHLVSSRVRTTDVFARWGGEEFVLLVPGLDAYMAGQLAEKLRDAIAQITFEAVGNITCSFGVAEYTKDSTVDSLVARADEALYRAKINGRNRVETAAAPHAAEPGLGGTFFSA